MTLLPVLLADMSEGKETWLLRVWVFPTKGHLEMFREVFLRLQVCMTYYIEVEWPI